MYRNYEVTLPIVCNLPGLASFSQSPCRHRYALAPSHGPASRRSGSLPSDHATSPARDHRSAVRHRSPLHANCYALAPCHGRFLIVLGVFDSDRCDLVPRQDACRGREHDIVPRYPADPLPFASLLVARSAPLWFPGITTSVANAREKCRRQPPSTLLVPFIPISSLLHAAM